MIWALKDVKDKVKAFTHEGNDSALISAGILEC